VTTVTARAPAKINLGLGVGARRADDYHPVATVYQAISLYDEVKARPAGPGEFRLTVTGEGSDSIPMGENNLAIRAARLLAERYSVEEGVALSVHKSIPAAGGLAGGSADAAGALVACDALWGTGAAKDELAELAEALGSDVPFCLLGGNAVGSDRGQILTPVLGRGTYEWVLAYAKGGLPTPDVYREFDRVGADARAVPQVHDGLMAALRTGDPYAVGRELYNDLQEPAIRLRPALTRTLEMGDEFGALGALVAGSGPTCLFLAADEEHAVDLAVGLSSSGLARTVQRATGPVPGARLVTS
jgi:4-diphosphocytidyl-2-C-methyl-D-erythritol kinase